MVKNIGYVYQPHYMTDKVRVAVADQQGERFNYVVICCSPSENGVYSWPAANKSKYEIWSNKRKKCYCIPISDLTFVQSLHDIKDSTIIKKIKSLQEKWFKGEVENRVAYKKEKPSWML